MDYLWDNPWVAFLVAAAYVIGYAVGRDKVRAVAERRQHDREYEATIRRRLSYQVAVIVSDRMDAHEPAYWRVVVTDLGEMGIAITGESGREQIVTAGEISLVGFDQAVNSAMEKV